VNDCINKTNSSAPPFDHESHALVKAWSEHNEKHIVVGLNKGNERHWGALVLDLMGRYAQAGIQTFLHHGYHRFRCNGPYVPAWKGKNVMWHPSLLGHELRAGHFSYAWLSVLRDAIKDTIKELELTSLESIAGRPSGGDTPLPPPLFPKTNISDGVRCFTDYRPRPDETMSLRTLVVSNNTLEPGGGSGALMPFVPGVFRSMFLNVFINVF
jgi:hypothetical protein